MQEAEVTVLNDGGTNPPARVPLQRDVTRIGRFAGNHIVLDDPRVSRSHARIIRVSGGYVVENTSGRNLIHLNGREVQRAELHDGDEIRIMKTCLQFHVTPPALDQTIKLDGGCVALDALNQDLILAGLDDRDVQALQRAKADLTSLYHAGRIISTSLSTSDLCDKTLDVILFEIKAVDCCSIHLFEPDTGEMQCKASRFRNAGPQEQPRSFSRGLLDKVLNELKAVLTSDAQVDDRFDATCSILSLHIRAAMCVPIQVQGRLTGILQAHTLDPGHTFNVDDLKLLTALGMMAGVAIQNAMLYEKLDADKTMQQERAQLMQVMLHELKSPIAAARTMASTLLATPLPPEGQEHFLGRIVTRLDGMLEWIRETLNLSDLKSGKSAVQTGRIDLTAAVKAIGESYKDQAAAKNLRYEIRTPESAVHVLSDARGLEMVLSNLVSNAIKYTADGKVSVVLRTDGGSAVVSVEDTGMGIPEKDVPRLFGEFFRASNAKRSGIEGSGVGLAGVKLIIERAGGTVGVSSRENAGATFTVRLPLCVLAPPAGQGPLS